jgi:two-component system, sensor histidine kinase
MDELDRLTRRLEREKNARIQAEELLENKSRELFLANQSLKALSENQEAIITERTQELIVARNQTIEAANAKMRFLANISHELLTPMNGILGNLQLLEKDIDAIKRSDCIQKAILASNALLKLLRTLLEIVELDQDKVHLLSIPFSPKALFDKISQDFSNKHLNLISTLSDEMPSLLLGDEARIDELCHHFLENAFKFTTAGKIQFRFQYKDQQLLIIIEDTGIGMSEEALARVMTPFTKGNEEHNRQYGGLGVGISISRRLIELMNGQLHIKSQTNIGTRIEIHIPLVETSQLLSIQKDQPILVVDDNPMNQQVAENLLSSLGYTTTIANNGDEAVQLCKQKPFSVILMDIQMPIMDGLIATQQIRAIPNSNQHTPIIAITAHSTQQDRQVSFLAGMNAHLTKPYSAKELASILYQFIEKPLSNSFQDAHSDTAEKSPDNDCKIPTLEGLDLIASLERVNNNWPLMNKILLIFNRNNQHTITDFVNAVHQQDWPVAIRISHTIKGSAATIGANQLSQIAANIENKLKSRHYLEASNFYSDLASEMNRVLKSLDSLAHASTEHSNATTQSNAVHKDIVSSIAMEITELLFSDLGEADKKLKQFLAIPDIVDEEFRSEIIQEYENFNLNRVKSLLENFNNQAS